jgi:hypothetical protein
MLLLPTSNVDHESDSGYRHQLAAMLQLEKVRVAQLALNCGLSAIDRVWARKVSAR